MTNELLADQSSDKKVLVLLSIYTFILLLICSHMSPIYYSNEWADVNVYFNIGKAMCNGRTLYTEVFDHKGPLIFFIYGLGYLISNDSFLGMFIIQFSGWVVMIYAIYRLANLYLNKVNAYLIAIIFPVFLIKLMKSGGSAEEFILIAECVSLYYFVKYFKEKDATIHNYSFMFIHGVMCSMVFFTKINLIVFWFFPLLGIFLNLLLSKEFKNFLINGIVFIAGFLVIAIPICLYLYLNDALYEAYAVYIDLNRKYAEVGTVNETIAILLYRLLYLYMEPLALCLFPLIGLFYFVVKYIGNAIGRCVLILSAFSMYFVIYLSPVFQYYYPIPFLVFAILGMLGIFLFFNKYILTTNLFNLKYIFVVSLIILYAGFSQKKLTQTRIAGLLNNEPGLLTQKMHDVIVKEKNPTLLNLGFGLGNSLFTTCKINPNVRYFFSPNLTHEAYPNLRDEQTKYIENKEVQFIVFLQPSMVHYSLKTIKRKRRGKMQTYDYFMNLPAFKENYSLVLTDTILSAIDENNLEIYTLYKRNN